MLLCMTFLSACSGDEENANEINNNPSRHIVKISYGNGNSIEETTYDYDNHGRVIMATETWITSNSSISATTTYTYGGSTIISNTQGDFDRGSCTYSLSADGLIVKSAENSYAGSSYSYTHSYDKDGYLISQSFNDIDGFFSGKILYNWEDGNLTKIAKYDDDGGSYILTIDYSSIPWPKNWMLYWKGTNMDEVFELIGAWGKMPKFLPNKFTYDYGDGWTIDYVIEKGEIVKVVFRDLEDTDKSASEVYTVEWEDDNF